MSKSNAALKAIPLEDGAHEAHVPARPVHIKTVGDTAPDWQPNMPGRPRTFPSWDSYMAMASRIVGRFHQELKVGYFDYMHPVRLQKQTAPRFRKAYAVKIAYTDWGPKDAPVVICCGGVTNTMFRFNYLAADLSSSFRVISMDWVGRGLSGWMSDENDYSLATCAEQLRQMILHLGGKPVTVLGSSLGGSAAIELAARHPRLVESLILNDIGPHMPRSRRKRRSETLARHYVFRNPSDLLRKIGASQKNDGPISDDIRFNLTFHQTRWCDAEGGRVYRHDVRAMQAYKRDAAKTLDQWKSWDKVRCPVMLIHGLLSDALLQPTIERMARTRPVKIMHVPNTGHTPVLADRNQIWFVQQWLRGNDDVSGEWTVLHAPGREAFPGTPVHFAPASSLA
jgi:pimeloyl-ACP methyl ester carboxylesterase